MSKELRAEEALNCWNDLLYSKLEDFEYFVAAIKSDMKNEGISGIQAERVIEERISKIRTELKQKRSQMFRRQR